MENQHRKISGYRELTQEEICLMNEVKDMEASCLALHEQVVNHLVNGSDAEDDAERARRAAAMPLRWCAIARTDLETGFMALVRAIAQPVPRSRGESCPFFRGCLRQWRW